MTTHSPQLTKLIKLLGMLGSDFDNEVVNAARAALTVMKQNNWTFAQLLTDAPAAKRPISDFELNEAYNRGYVAGKTEGLKEGRAETYKRKRAYTYPTDDPREQYREAMVWYAKFNPKAQEFLDGLAVRLDRYGDVTPKQAAWLGDLYRKARGYSYERDQHKGQDI